MLGFDAIKEEKEPTSQQDNDSDFERDYASMINNGKDKIKHSDSNYNIVHQGKEPNSNYIQGIIDRYNTKRKECEFVNLKHDCSGHDGHSDADEEKEELVNGEKSFGYYNAK